MKSFGLLGFHNFTGGDWGGKIVGISKKTWAEAYLELDDSCEIVKAFKNLGEKIISSELVGGEELPHEIRPLETFTCKCYSKDGPRTLPELRWELFRTNQKEGEMLPPTRGSFLPHVQRANYVTMRYKSYPVTCPKLPQLDQCGWQKMEQSEYFMPIHSVLLPASKAVIELTKCQCHKGCTGKCSCKKILLTYTPLCKCYRSECNNPHTKNGIRTNSLHEDSDSDTENDSDEEN